AGAPASAVRFDTARADLAIGNHIVTQREGRYHLVGQVRGSTGPARFDLILTPEPNAYFPPVELRHDDFVSGYGVPALRATVSGTLCEGSSCRRLEAAPAYHDHNWGVWRETTWNWGQGRGRSSSLVYGGVLTPDSIASPGASPYFLAVVDSVGVQQV